jgi:hypothetical protein
MLFAALESTLISSAIGSVFLIPPAGFFLFRRFVSKDKGVANGVMWDDSNSEWIFGLFRVDRNRSTVIRATKCADKKHSDLVPIVKRLWFDIELRGQAGFEVYTAVCRYRVYDGANFLLENQAKSLICKGTEYPLSKHCGLNFLKQLETIGTAVMAEKIDIIVSIKISSIVSDPGKAYNQGARMAFGVAGLAAGDVIDSIKMRRTIDAKTTLIASLRPLTEKFGWQLYEAII